VDAALLEKVQKERIHSGGRLVQLVQDEDDWTVVANLNSAQQRAGPIGVCWALDAGSHSADVDTDEEFFVGGPGVA
jgi:hypothetical protein